MVWVGIVTALALIEYMVMGVLVSRARGRYEVAAPSTTGNPIFERYFRVHQNMLEALIVFVPALWLFADYVSTRGAIVLGFLFVIARIFYAIGYVREPSRRVAGVAITMLVNVVLIIGSLMALIRAAL